MPIQLPAACVYLFPATPEPNTVVQSPNQGLDNNSSEYQETRVLPSGFLKLKDYAKGSRHKSTGSTE